MPYTPATFTTTAVIDNTTTFRVYPAQIQQLMSDAGTYLVGQSSALATYFATATGYSATVLDQYFYGIASCSMLTGGGTITVDASSNILWSQRFITASNGFGATTATIGYFDINCPTSGTITGVGGAANKTATAAGIPLATWEALYYILPLGSTNTSLPANFRVVGLGSTLAIPPSWVKIAQRNQDGTYVEFANGISLRPGSSINTNLYDVLASDVSGLSGVYAPLVSPVFTTPNIGVASGTSFNSITGLSSTSPVMNGAVAVGTATTAARADHVHPTDTSIAAGLALKADTTAMTAAIAASNTLLAEYVVSGAAVTSIDFSGLDIATHKSYRVEIDWVNVTTAGYISMFANNDTVATNYYSQYVNANSTTNTDGRLNTAEIINCSISGASCSATIRVSLANSYVTAFSSSLTATGANIKSQTYAWSKTATIANLTQLTFVASVASTIGIGTKIRIYRGDK